LPAPTYERYGHTKRRIFDYRKDESKPGKNGGDGENLTSYNSTPMSLDYFAAQLENFPFESSQSSYHYTSYSPTPERNAKKRENPFDEIDLNLTPRSDNTAKLCEDILGVNKTLGHSEPGVNSTSRGKKHLDICYEKNIEGGNTDENISQESIEIEPKKVVIPSPITPRKPGDIRATTFNPRNLGTSPSCHKSWNPHPRQNLTPIKRPLCIRSLESITGPHAIRNKVFDFFAVIFSIEAQVVKPPMMPLKRDLRIVDPSTDKKVLVSVFVNPLNFKPSIGTVALFRSLTTHEWDRGMLNAYPQQCEGKDWFIVDPVGIEGCDVPALRNWWKLKFAESDKKGNCPN
jgi:hypothetical protein